MLASANGQTLASPPTTVHHNASSMACINSSCQSGACSNYTDTDTDNNGNGGPNSSPTNDRRRLNPNPNICVKCKLRTVISATTGIAGDDGRYCSDCFRASLFGKFRFAVTSNGMISSTDKVLVAFSGGTCSRVALQFVHEMQDKAQKNFDASRDKSLTVFGVGVAFIEESSAHSCSAEDVAEVIQHVKSVVDDLTPPEKELHIVRLENLYSSNVNDGKIKLRELLDAVSDDTGKEDLLTQLRMLCLQKVAVENGFTKLVLGSCTSFIARRVISSTVKGQGYSLSADIQYVDARWRVPVLLPLRDCLAQELGMLCQLDGLKTLTTVNGPSNGINGLVSSFISLLQEENPSRECTIVRTAGKLIPFSFNKLPDTDDPKARLASQRREKKFNIKSDELTPPVSFCPLCYSPLYNSGSSDSVQFTSEQHKADILGAACCYSCKFQILPDDRSSLEQFYLLLPQPILVRSPCSSSSSGGDEYLREKIRDFLLSDSEDDT